jgi:aconitate hydratase
MVDFLGARSVLEVQGRRYRIARLAMLQDAGFEVERLPWVLRILLENLLRRAGTSTVPARDIEALASWQADASPSDEIQFMPARVLLQDFTGVPAVVDLAAMRDAMVEMGGDPERINPLQPVELVIDHSVQVDEYGSQAALLLNAGREFERNEERYRFLRWGQEALRNFRVVPPATGIVHQVNLEYLARVVMTGAADADGLPWAYPDTLVGTDSHTTMINGLGVLGWGVGGIEAEAAMLGQPIAMLIPQVVGFRLSGSLPPGATATDLVLRVTEILRGHGVVDKFVEFFGPGLEHLRLADRATIANMAPEYGATCGIFPVDRLTLDYLSFTGRSDEQVRLAEAYLSEQGLFHRPNDPEARYSELLGLDLGTVEPSLAGPRRPQDRVRLAEVGAGFRAQLPSLVGGSRRAVVDADSGGVATTRAVAPTARRVTLDGKTFNLDHGSVVIAAITSCTNTSNPSVMMAAGLLAKKAVEAGLEVKPWVKTSLAPGSKVVTKYLRDSGLLGYLEHLRFHVVGYGCTTCIGNSGPLPAPISEAIADAGLVTAAVLSGNRNFEGRIHAEVRANYLASPPLVVAYALAGRIDVDLTREPVGIGTSGPVYLRDIWPAPAEVEEAMRRHLRSEMFSEEYADVFAGDEQWRALRVPEGETFTWEPDSTYVRKPPFFDQLPRQARPVEDIAGARVLAVLGDSVTTDHISPAGAIKADSPAGRYLREQGVALRDFNSYGSRRGNHEVMMRGTFANVRLRNRLVPEIEGGFTLHLPDGEPLSIYDAAMKYVAEGVPLLVLAGKEYGTGSSRDWAAKGSLLLGVGAVLAESFERIHRSNLIGMGVAPLQFLPGDSVEALGLSGREVFQVTGLAAFYRAAFTAGARVTVRATADDGPPKEFEARLRLDTPQEAEYYRHGGILPYVLRQLLETK